jgi:hypothetical protein
MAHNQLHKLRINIMKAVDHSIANRKTFSLQMSQVLQVFQFRRNNEAVAAAQNVALVDLGAFKLGIVASEVGREKSLEVSGIVGGRNFLKFDCVF